MTTEVSSNNSSASTWTGELRLDPQIHGESRVPGAELAGFNLLDFARAVENRDVDYQTWRYTSEAELCIVDPDNPPCSPLVVRGRPEIRAWLLHADTSRLGLRVTDLVDGGDRVAFTERWHRHDGTAVLATSTAEIDDALIAVRHTIVAWDRPS